MEEDQKGAQRAARMALCLPTWQIFVLLMNPTPDREGEFRAKRKCKYYT